MWFYTRTLERALVAPHSISASPTFQNLIVYEATMTDVPTPPADATLFKTIELTIPLSMNGDRSPMNLPDIKNIADILKNSVESLWNTYGLKYFLTVAEDLYQKS